MEIVNSSSNCEKFDTATFKGLVSVQAALSIFSSCCILLALVLTFCFQSHQQLLSQRRVLFLVLSTLASSLVTGINVVGYEVYRSSHLERYCKAVGFLHQLSTWWTILAICCIMIDVSLKLGAVNQARCVKRLELVYVTVTFISPLLLNCWIPFLFEGYGPAGPICWIRYMDTNETSDCQSISSGIHLTMALYFIPVGFILVLLAMCLLTMLAVLHVKTKELEKKFDYKDHEMYKVIKNDLKPVLIYPTIFVITSVPNFILTIFPLTHQSLDTLLIVLWYLTTSLLQLQGMFYSLVLVFQRDGRSGINLCTEMRNRYRGGYQRISDYPITQEGSDSVKDSETEEEPLNSANSQANPI